MGTLALGCGWGYSDTDFGGQRCDLMDSTVFLRASLVAQTVKNPLAMQETWVQSLGQEDSLGEGNGYPLQYSCLENSMDKGAIAKNWT